MRTTMTLDPDVVRLIQDAVHRQRRPTKHVINDALRRALTPPCDTQREAYHVEPHESRLRPGHDLTGFNRLSDELEDEAIIDSMRGVT